MSRAEFLLLNHRLNKQFVVFYSFSKRKEKDHSCTFYPYLNEVFIQQVYNYLCKTLKIKTIISNFKVTCFTGFKSMFTCILDFITKSCAKSFNKLFGRIINNR